jgi:hypothetical protein
VEDDHDKQDEKVMVDGRGQADESGAVNGVWLHGRDAYELGMG